MNIYDISNKAGVSIATVSRVINGNTNVSPKTREKVMAIIDEYGYTPNAFARGLGLNSMNTVGILCADSSDPYLARAIYLLERDLRGNGYDSILCCTGYHVKTKQKYLNLVLSTKRVDAVILVGSNFVEVQDEKNQYIRDVAKNVPIMIINGAMDGENIYSVLCDDFRAVYDVTKALIRCGQSNILYLYNSLSYSGLKKVAGYRAAFEDEHLMVKEDYIQYFEGNIIEVKNHLLKLSNKGFDFNAIITSDDNLAIGALKYAKEKGIKIPTELSIIGYNNSMITECCEPELTSIDNKLETVCKNCVSSLMSVFAGDDVPLKTVFSADLVKRGTTFL
ncbi:LacI family DNA-binding transcriptional regulator [Anaeromicropila populeti]|uniref:Transcriptional regulator, LacI family n=1 Tax=Anaeromicropila populeti TaxID=37658 RepID=A0A1I6I904_9FIRM|nr:LacI family DNA-binding transcriptional regulator [Anaeromicropila populeti]SFR63196.1 transcriptional regulator, LacI family [Anaeromicropila populeti]